MKAIAPMTLTPALAALCKELVPGATPVVLPRLAPLDQRPGDCFDTVVQSHESRAAVQAGAAAAIGQRPGWRR